MPSFKTAAVTLVTMLVASVQADYVIDPDSVSMSMRRTWCDSEMSTCPIICQQTSDGKPIINTCDPKTLTYGCVCSDNKQPNISEYTLTLPYFTCTEWGNQCVTKCESNNECSRDCREKHPCGALNPKKPNTTATVSQSATATGAQASDTNKVFNGLDDSGAPADKPKSAAVSLEMANLFSFMTVAASMALGFGYLL